MLYCYSAEFFFPIIKVPPLGFRRKCFTAVSAQIIGNVKKNMQRAKIVYDVPVLAKKAVPMVSNAVFLKVEDFTHFQRFTC
jgi:hypothetical protein